MNRVKLHPDGNLTTETGVVVREPLISLGHQLQLADDCSLRSMFRMLEKYSILTRLGEFYPALMEQYGKCPQSGCRWDAFDSLELAKIVEMVGHPGKPRIDIYTVLRGAGAQKPVDIRPLALAFLLDMPLRLGCLKHVIFGDSVDTFTCETMYTLFEFIDSIAWELSFHSIPAQCNI
jgi:hypothetical protein